MAWLDDNPPARDQFRFPRREEPSGVCVVHTAESTPDTTGADSGAENVARFIRDRPDPGSYHDLCDSDSAIQLVRYDAEAYHDATGSNPHSYGVSASTQAHRWSTLPQAWVDGCVHQMAAAAARYAHWLHQRSGIVIPARRISRSESELRAPGFISHAERDPERRTDPGASFPWGDFLSRFAALTADLQEDDVTPEEHAWLDKMQRRLDVVYDAYRMPGQEWSGNLPGRVDVLYALRDLGDVDEAEVARQVLAVLTPQAIAAAIPDQLAAEVADELADRLAG